MKTKINKNYSLHFILKKCKIAFKKKIVKDVIISNVSDLASINNNSIGFFSNKKYLKNLYKTKLTAILIKKEDLKYLPKNIIYIECNNPELEFIKILSFFYPDSYYSKISYNYLEQSEIKKKFKNIKFGINLYLEENVKIGSNVYIGNNVTIKRNTHIGNNVIIGSNVVIENSIIGNNVHICDGSIIGKKGFGFKFINNRCLRIPHLGKVIIEKGCEIGSNCVIDRGSIVDTIIKRDTFIDNLVHIAHNVQIGKKCIIAAQVGIAGSTKIGNNVNIGGQVGISGHLKIGDNVRIGGKSGVIKNIDDNSKIMGYPSKPIKEFLKKNL